MKTRILIVDDERWFTNLMKYSLEREGYFDVRQENDATRALQAARTTARTSCCST
jgi:DNA-binding response OmpR family regulator